VNGVQYNGLYVSGDSLGNYSPATPLALLRHGRPPRTTPQKRSVDAAVEAVGTETDATAETAVCTGHDFMIDQAWSIVFAERAVICRAQRHQERQPD
jgi:hypothetical protein